MKPQTHLTTLSANSLPANGHAQQPTLNDDPAVASILAARNALLQRGKELDAERAHIQRLLDGEQTDVLPATSVSPTLPSAAPPSPVQPRRSNAGLRQAVTALLADGPLTKDQLVEKLLAQKFEFYGMPKPALDPVLYSKKFRREGRLFSLAANP
jgi:hypothetical protein